MVFVSMASMASSLSATLATRSPTPLLLVMSASQASFSQLFSVAARCACSFASGKSLFALFSSQIASSTTANCCWFHSCLDSPATRGPGVSKNSAALGPLWSQQSFSDVLYFCHRGLIFSAIHVLSEFPTLCASANAC